MRIGFVSTFPPIECGIATYTQYLNTALRKGGNETFVISQYGAQGHAVFPVFHHGSASFANDVFNTSTRMTPDVVHIQHEYGLYGPQRGVGVIELILRCCMAGIPVVVTLHTVYEDLKPDEHLILRHMVQDCGAVIVHEDYQKDTLLRYFGALPDAEKKIHVIEHGVREVTPIPDAKQKLELTGKKVVLLCGYFRPSKGFHKIIDIFPQVCEEEPDAFLVVAGKTRNIEYVEYRRELFTNLNESPVTDRIAIFRGQFPQYTFDTIIAAADIVALPYEAGAQSGMMAQCFAQGVPVVTSGLPAFKRLLDRSGGGRVAESDADYKDLIVQLLHDDALRADLQANIRAYIKKQAGWSRIAEAHTKVYQSVVTTPYGKARYIYFPEPGEDPAGRRIP
ncbi:MAG: glycosyltransferase [Lentisphaerae bacterium]|nr:glycosyltransferase [Lentisphaerota bacterium]